jgi:hypothetical protein
MSMCIQTSCTARKPPTQKQTPTRRRDDQVLDRGDEAPTAPDEEEYEEFGARGTAGIEVAGGEGEGTIAGEGGVCV